MFHVTGEQAAFLKRAVDSGLLAELHALGAFARFEAESQAGSDILALRPADGLILNFGFEWCGPMWLAASRGVLASWRSLLARDLTFWSLRQGDVIFDSTRPVVVNPCVLSPFTRPRFDAGVRSFLSNFLAPARLVALGKGGLVRACLRGHLAALPPGALEGSDLLPGADTAGWSEPAAALLQLEEYIAGLGLPDAPSRWRGYYLSDPPLQRDAAWEPKRIAVERMLRVLNPVEVLDIACNTGWYSRLAGDRGARVVSIDSDEACVAELFTRASRGAQRILPLVCDVLDPSPGLGYDNRQWPSARDRLASDFVMALALTHHLMLGRGMSAREVVAALSSWTKRWLAVEFVPLHEEAQNPYLRSIPEGTRAGYSLEGFGDALAERFSQIAVVPSPENGRQIFLCEI